MIDQRNTINITGGMDVFGADGEKVGSVAGVEGDYVVVSKGFFFPTDYYIPSNAINTADDEGVYLNVTKDDALNQGWDAIPTGSSGAGTIAEPFEHRADSERTHTDDSETIHVPLTEEELTAQKREVDRGAVHVDKLVTEQEQTLDVPVTEERVNVSRRVVDRDVNPDDRTFEEGTIDVPVHGEEVDVQKNTRV